MFFCFALLLPMLDRTDHATALTSMAFDDANSKASAAIVAPCIHLMGPEQVGIFCKLVGTKLTMEKGRNEEEDEEEGDRRGQQKTSTWLDCCLFHLSSVFGTLHAHRLAIRPSCVLPPGAPCIDGRTSVDDSRWTHVRRRSHRPV